MERLLYQEPVYETLTRLWQGGRFGHALLFEGAPGSGKRTIAYYAAAMLLCPNEETAPCGVCSACRKALRGRHPDLTVLDGDVEKVFSVDNIRGIIQSAYVAPNESKRRVVLLLEAQKMSPAAQGTLLKILEEPPEHLCFLLTVTSRAALLDTILSRVKEIPMQELEERQRREALYQLCPDADPVLLRQASDAFETVGMAKDALSDPHTGALLLTVSSLCDAAAAQDRYRLLCLLSEYESKREDYCEMLSLLRTAFIRRTLDRNPVFSALQCTRIVAIIEKTQIRAMQNVTRSLLSVVLADGMLAAISPRREDTLRGNSPCGRE